MVAISDSDPENPLTSTQLEIKVRVERFKSDVARMDNLGVVQRHVIHGGCYKLTDNQYFDLKAAIGRHFEINPIEVLIVGSAKLGFSIAPQKRYQHFRDESDIDVAIVSSVLFDRFWREAFEFAMTGRYWPQRADFEKYLFRGWIRPDKFPPARTFTQRQEWWEFFQQLTSSGHYGPYQIRAGLYKSWFYLEQYHSICVSQVRDDLGR